MAKKAKKLRRIVKAARKAAWKAYIHPRHKLLDQDEALHTNSSNESRSNEPNNKNIPTLGDRFHSLAGELRAEIFAWLLVRPVKWDVKHKPLCEKRKCPNPYFNIDPWAWHEEGVVCATTYTTDEWRCRPDGQGSVADVHPWRSQWAPEQRNPYICDRCYDDRYRCRPSPRAANLPCLCARRENLQTLLVCRQWYEEAGHVFYTRNTFGFTRPHECAAFLTNMSPRWRGFVTKISFLVECRDGFAPTTADEELAEMRSCLRPDSELEAMWGRLLALPALSELELDSILLTGLNWASILTALRFRNVRRVTFARGNPGSMMDPESKAYVWPRLANRRIVGDSKFVVNTARRLKGSHKCWGLVRYAEHEKNERLEGAVRAQRRAYVKEFRAAWNVNR